MIIYDIEIENPIPPENGQLVPGIKYSKGWNYPATMGIACIGVYNYARDTYRVFGEFELDEFKELISKHDVLVGFNNIGFDNLVLRTCNVEIPDSKCYDILAEIYRSLGSRQKGCKLENVIKANNFPASKNGDGAKAPILWQQKYYTKVIDYCLNDVYMTKLILDRILHWGHIKNPINPNQLLRMRRP